MIHPLCGSMDNFGCAALTASTRITTHPIQLTRPNSIGRGTTWLPAAPMERASGFPSSLMAPQIDDGSSWLDARRWKRNVYRFAHYSGLTKVIRGRYAGCGSLLMFHEVQDDEPAGLTGGVSPQFFEDLLRWLRTQGRAFISLGDVLRWHQPSERFVCLTFDDGYRDNVANAL